MMRGILLAVFTVLAVAGLAVMQADRTVSWALSRHYGADVQVRGVGWDGWGGFSAESFAIAPEAGGQSWLAGGRAEVRFPSFPSLDTARVAVTGLEAGESARRKLQGYASWFGDESFLTDARLDRVLLLAVRRGGFWQVRVIEASSGHFAIAGGARFDSGRLVKMDIRWSVSEPLFSRWPESVTRRMIPAGDGWKAAGLAFGGSTWTLRGLRGPLLQFSGNMAS